MHWSHILFHFSLILCFVIIDISVIVLQAVLMDFSTVFFFNGDILFLIGFYSYLLDIFKEAVLSCSVLIIFLSLPNDHCSFFYNLRCSACVISRFCKYRSWGYPIAVIIYSDTVKAIFTVLITTPLHRFICVLVISLILPTIYSWYR